MTTKMKRQVIDANAFWMGQWGQSIEREFHVGRTSVLCFIKVLWAMSAQ
jgi:hypothetical protein